MACVMLLVFLLLASILCGTLCVPVGNQELADSLKWSRESVEADLKAVAEQKLERFFKIDEYLRCVVAKETKLLDVAVTGLSSAAHRVEAEGNAYFPLMGLLDVLDGNGRMVVETSNSIQGLRGFKSRFGDILSMSLGYPGDKNFAKRVEAVRKTVPRTAAILKDVEDIPAQMLDKFDSFASVENCAADIRK